MHALIFTGLLGLATGGFLGPHPGFSRDSGVWSLFGHWEEPKFKNRAHFRIELFGVISLQHCPMARGLRLPSSNAPLERRVTGAKVQG